MPRKTLVSQLFTPFLLITLITLVVIGAIALNVLRDFYYNQAREDLNVRSALVERQVRSLMSSGQSERIDPLCRDLAQSAKARLTLILVTGKVLCDSEKNSREMENHRNRPEVLTALEGDKGSAVRFSETLQVNMMYVTRPMSDGGEVTAVVRVALPLTQVEAGLDRMFALLLLSGGAIVFVAAATSLFFSRRLSREMDMIKSRAVQFARGDFSARIPASPSVEIDGLSVALNDMARQLDDRVRTITEQHHEQQAMLASMVEAVLAVDSDEKIIHMNQAAGQLVDLSPDEVQGQPIQEVVRNSQLQAFIARALESFDPIEADLVLTKNGEDLYLQARGTVLRNANDSAIGAMIVLNDVTRLRRLENIRRDFVANVSHELKTPITSIKGFVETLLDGALEQPEDARRFLGIVAKQADRLNAIIEDLLSLSRIEQGADEDEILTQECDLREVLETVLGDCQHAAEQNKVTLELDCDAGMTVRINPPLLEEALINLVDNAIKYSENGQSVSVSARQEDARLEIRVADQGCGIPSEHLPRLFERFYRVDKARSRQMGGTGLGLAIVKHIAQAHGGTVEVVSAPDSGSTFFIKIPQETIPASNSLS